MRLLYKDNYDISTWKATVWTIFLCLVLPALILGWWNISFEEGYEITIEGTVQLHRMEYEKGPWWNYPYTAMELRTFSGDTHHLELYGHVPLMHGQLYRITYIRISPLGHHIFLIGKVIEIEEIGG